MSSFCSCFKLFTSCAALFSRAAIICQSLQYDVFEWQILEDVLDILFSQLKLHYQLNCYCIPKCYQEGIYDMYM